MVGDRRVNPDRTTRPRLARPAFLRLGLRDCAPTRTSGTLRRCASFRRVGAGAVVSNSTGARAIAWGASSASTPTAASTLERSVGDMVALVGLTNTPHRRHAVLSRCSDPCSRPSGSPTRCFDRAVSPDTVGGPRPSGRLPASRLCDEDPTAPVLSYDAETASPSSRAWGSCTSEIIVDRLRREFNVSATVGPARRWPYRETATAHRRRGREVHQANRRRWPVRALARSGWNRWKKAEALSSLTMWWAGASLFFSYIPAVDKRHPSRPMVKGPLRRLPVVDMRVVLVGDGSVSRGGFQRRHRFPGSGTHGLSRLVPAGGLRNSWNRSCRWKLLRRKSLSAPSRRPLQPPRPHRHHDPGRPAQVVTANVPLAEMFGYSATLRTLTQGRGMYTMQFDHYEEVPKNIAEQIITKAQK